MSDMTVAKVAVENTVYHFDKAFDYLIPTELVASAKPGCRVLIPFGAANSKRLGMILELEMQSDTDKIKSVLAVLDKAPLLSNEALHLIPWLKEHYFCTLFEAAKLLLPTGINLKIKTQYSLAHAIDSIDLAAFEEAERCVIAFLSHKKVPAERELLLKAVGLATDSPVPEMLCKAGVLVKNSEAVRQVGDATQKMVRLIENRDVPKFTPKQRCVYQVLCDVGSASLKELCYFSGVTSSVVDSLVAKGTAQYYDFEIYRNPYDEVQNQEFMEEIVLSKEQQTAYQNLYQQYRSASGGVSLLYGVTGSGKTSVFMRLIDEVKADGRGIIVMVPEISLTPQTIFLFHQRYGRSVAVFHSGLSLAERLDEWKRVNNGEALIAVGTRSAVFAPFQNLGLIIMDEEQEYTYKSESSPRYHARDVAKFRGAYHKALLVLSSATPSIESYFLAQNGRYYLNTLSTRYGEAKLPQVTVTDMNLELENGNNTILSTELFHALEENLKNKKQSIVLLNRRGYNTFASCKACGHVVTCPNCSISLTYHSANQRLMCHYCGYSVPFTKECPVCHESKVHYAGFGTQRGEEQLQELLPDARILRLDTDSTLTRFAYEKKLKLFSEGEYDIIIGTQMVAKGLDFENVTLVGVLSADQALYGDDFRSYERAFDLLTQVVGRSGRGKYTGRAIIQTFTPENDIIKLAAEQDYPQFYAGEIAMRKAMLYPPFSDICMIGFVGTTEGKVQKASVSFLSMLSLLAQSNYSDQPMRVLKPSPALISKVNNKYRYKLIIKCRNNLKFREMVSRLLIQFAGNRDFSGVTVFVDMNPDMIM
jgi:primosomal protein N' (replication factor Y) (superfamily II helicase)